MIDFPCAFSTVILTIAAESESQMCGRILSCFERFHNPAGTHNITRIFFGGGGDGGWQSIRAISLTVVMLF